MKPGNRDIYKIFSLTFASSVCFYKVSRIVNHLRLLLLEVYEMFFP